MTAVHTAAFRAPFDWWRSRPARPLPSAAPMELRVDVQVDPATIDAELARLHERLHDAGSSLYALTRVPSPWPELVFHYRIADGEHYVYVEDVARGRLAGYTVFNRLIELDRRAGRHVRAPHSKYAVPYQRRGIASAVYEWALLSGICLISGPRQSTAAHALWLALGRRHSLCSVRLRNRTLALLPGDSAADGPADLYTRMVLFGNGWSLPRFLADTGCAPLASAATPAS